MNTPHSNPRHPLTPLQLTLLCTLGLSQLTPLHAWGDRSWNEANDPRNMGRHFKMKLSELPLSGEMEDHHKGWSDSFWPKKFGYVLDRWQTPVRIKDFKEQKSPSVAEVQKFSVEELNLLSPLEKLDLANGDLHFPKTKKLREDLRETSVSWRGLCDGWSHASLQVAEPHPIRFPSQKLGKEIHFGSSDLKGLLAYYHAKVGSKTASARYIGKSCRKMDRILLGIGGDCKDVHPASFHIMMANVIGIEKRGFLADRDRTTEVWNHPFVKYESVIKNINNGKIAGNATDGTVAEYTIESTVTFVNELYQTHNELEETADFVAPSYEPVLGTSKQSYKTVKYEYTLEVDAAGRIIGGEWNSWVRPDLIWDMDPMTPSGNWKILQELVEMATAYTRP